MQRRCLGIGRHRLSPCPYCHIVYDHLVRNYVTFVVETTFPGGAQITGVSSLGRLNFCPLAPVVGSRYGFALFHPGARMLKLLLDFWKISAPPPGIIIEKLYKARKVNGSCDRNSELKIRDCMTRV